MTLSGSNRSLNPAASRSRMWIALGGLLVLGLLSWFTIDGSAVVHVNGFSNRLVSFGDRDVPIRWFPILILSLFAFRTVLANMRGRLEERDSQQG
jgi:hypothetical protein